VRSHTNRSPVSYRNIAHLDIQIRFISFTSLVSIRQLVNPSLSSSRSFITPSSLLHSRTSGSKPTFSTNPSHLRLILPTGLPLIGLDRTYHAYQFIFSFTFYFFCCLFRVEDYPSAFYYTFNTHYGIVIFNRSTLILNRDDLIIPAPRWRLCDEVLRSS